MKQIASWLFSLVVGTVLLISTLFFPTQVDSRQDMHSVAHGFPLVFVLQDISSYDPPDFPISFPFISPWENPVTLLWVPFFLGLFFYTFIVFAVITNLQKLFAKPKNKPGTRNPA